MNTNHIARFVHTIHDAISDIPDEGLSDLELALAILRTGRGRIKVKDGEIIELEKTDDTVFSRHFLIEEFFKLELYLSIVIAFKVGSFYFNGKGIYVLISGVVFAQHDTRRSAEELL